MTNALNRGKALAATALLLLASAACAASAPSPTLATPPAAKPAEAPAVAPATPALPPGVLQIRIGTAVRDRSATGVPRCMIPEPLPAPQRFEPGTTEIGYTIAVNPQMVKGVTAKVVGDLGCPDPWTQGCAGFTVCGGGVCQNQYGATVKCPGDKPLQKGAYKLVLTVGERTVELPFEIE